MRVIGRDFVREHLTYPDAIRLVRAGMMALSNGQSIQPLRSILRMAEGRMFGLMPGALGEWQEFGAKLVSVFPNNSAAGLQSHQGGILIFEPETGKPVALVHAGEVTGIRTGAASAAATDAMARAEAEVLTLVGYGEQAVSHLHALADVRPFRTVWVTGRSPEKAEAFAATQSRLTGLDVRAEPDIDRAVAQADILCTVTASSEPDPSSRRDGLPRPGRLCPARRTARYRSADRGQRGQRACRCLQWCARDLHRAGGNHPPAG